VAQLRGMLRSPEIIVATWRAAWSQIEGLSEDVVRKALEQLDPISDELVVSRIFRTFVRWPAPVKRSSRCAA
jgi:hypothetical protein